MFLHSAELIQSFAPLKVLYTSPPGSPVHSDTNSTTLGSIQPCFNYCAKAIHSECHVLQLSTARCSFLQLRELGCYGENENAKPQSLSIDIWHSTAQLSHYSKTSLYSEQSRDPTKCSLYRGVHPRGSPRFSYSRFLFRMLFTAPT